MFKEALRPVILSKVKKIFCNEIRAVHQEDRTIANVCVLNGRIQDIMIRKKVEQSKIK